jgi:hypothetical protein
MKYFFYDATDDEYDDDESNDGFKSNGTIDEILQSFYDLSEEAGSFLGLENEQGLVLQFMRNSDDKWLIDIPEAEKEGSWQKYADYDECVSLIEDFYNEKPVDITKFTFESYHSQEKQGGDTV